MRSEEIGKRGVACAEAWGVGIGVGVGVGVGLGVGVTPIVPTGSPIAVGDWLGVGLGVEDGIGFGETTFTPLLQTNFFPDLIQVYV